MSRKVVHLLFGRDPSIDEILSRNNLLFFTRRIVANKRLNTLYIDASFAIHHDAKSHTGAILSFGPNGGTIFAKSSKQKLVTWSSTEAELVAVHDAMGHAIHVRAIIEELVDLSWPIILYQDNQSTISLISSQEAVGQRSRHINLRYFSIREYVENDVVIVQYLPTSLMKADILTKPLSGALFTIMRDWILNL